MSSEPTDARRTAYRTELQLSYRQLVQALDDINTARVSSGQRVSGDDLAVLERSIMTMRTQMRPLITDAELSQIWREYDIDRVPVECAIEETTTKTHPDTGTEIQKSRTTHAPIQRLEVFGEGLLMLYVELGFAPEREDKQIEASGDYSDILD